MKTESPTIRMISGLAVAAILLLVRSVSSSCSCSVSPPSGPSINCSSQNLDRIPYFPSNTTELYLQHNRLVTVPPGFFDTFLQLRSGVSGTQSHRESGRDRVLVLREERCSGAGYNLALVFLLCGILGLLLWSLHLAKGLSFTLGIGEKHGGLQAESLRSLKPKHRATARYLTQWSDDLETPLLDMDILPQIIDTLHKHHNIKIKEL
ncbi:hypothetical protein AMELA_G00192530 [Ameiurus melas]|uniref:Uncharacterized protein n=1 Tax=Ameiurus melas TaxID=219545 RepID=A0A7J6A6N6_AMEME|nr:hypothetical protein AMELA_G00192530 [Ameiurus melas]